jgi:hypothetical protein
MLIHQDSSKNIDMAPPSQTWDYYEPFSPHELVSHRVPFQSYVRYESENHATERLENPKSSVPLMNTPLTPDK